MSLENAKGKERIEILHQLCVGTWLHDPKQALVYAEEALTISEEMVDSANIIKSFRLIGAAHYYQGDLETSLLFNEMALAMAISRRDSTLINNSYNNVGLLHYNLGDYQTALEYFLRSLKIKEAIKEKYGLDITINNIGLVYERVGNFRQARKHFKESYLIALESNNTPLIIYTLNNQGTTYLKEGNAEVAKEYFTEALRLAKRENNVNYGAVAHRRMGSVMQMEGQYDSAAYYFNKSLEMCLDLNEKRGVSEVYYLIANLNLELDKPDKSIEFLSKSHDIALELKLRQQLLDNLKLFARINKETDNFHTSNVNLIDYIALSDSLFQDVIQRNLKLIPIKIQEEEDRLLLARQEVAIKDHAATRRLYFIIFIVVVAIVFFLGFLVRKIRKANIVLKESHQELKRTQNLLIVSEKMASLGSLVSGIGHEINNPLNFIKNGSQQLAKEIENGNTNMVELLPYFHAIDEGVIRASKIVKTLSHLSKVSPDFKEECDLVEILENCLILLNNTMNPKVEVRKNYGSAPVIVLGEKGKLHQAFVNILSNAEHSIDQEGQIDISIEKNQDHVEIKISDTGIGIPTEHLLKVSDPFFTTKGPGKGVGLGLFVTYSIIEDHKGKVEIVPNPTGGTIVTVSLPLSN